MLTLGNRKLGDHLIWTWSIPSVQTCPGRTKLCERECYAARAEQYRAGWREKLQKNLELCRRRDWVVRFQAAIVANAVKVVRLHVAGDIFAVWYARKLLVVMCWARTRGVRFFFYTRSWRLARLKPWVDRMARLKNVRVYYSCDAESGMPPSLPKRARVAWMMTQAGEVIPAGVNLVFKTQRLRREPEKRIGLALVCPVENGVETMLPVTCERCGWCWRGEPRDLGA